MNEYELYRREAELQASVSPLSDEAKRGMSPEEVEALERDYHEIDRQMRSEQDRNDWGLFAFMVAALCAVALLAHFTLPLHHDAPLPPYTPQPEVILTPTPASSPTATPTALPVVVPPVVSATPEATATPALPDAGSGGLLGR